MKAMREFPMTVGDALREGEARLSESETSRIDTELLLCHALGRGRAWLYAERNSEMGRKALDDFSALLQRRERGEPVAYIVGRREFWSLALDVTPDTLIPRPETECVVNRCLELLDPVTSAQVADLGTGSGAIALALASERPGWRITAVDVSPDACEVARQNAARLDLHNVTIEVGDWCAPLDGVSLDLIVSNPPYVAMDDHHVKEGDVRFEPPLALIGGEDGLSALRTLCTQAGKYLQAGGWLVLEHGHDQATACSALLEANGFMNVTSSRDLAGVERVISAQWPGP